MALYLGIDLGTSYFKAGLFDDAGSLRGLGRVAVEPQTPAPGRVEVPVEVFWQRLRQALDQALAEANAGPDQVAALSYSSQANSFILLDRGDRALTPLILWTDARTGSVSEDWEAFAQSEAFQRHVGFQGISGGSAVGTWRWFADHEPAIWPRVRWQLTISDYFTFAMTGERVGDASTAAFLGLYDLAAKVWWPEALRTFGVDPERLARPLRPGTRCGLTTRQGAALLGVPAGIPVAVGGLDHHIAAFGSGVGRFADMSISTGTVLAALGLVDEPSQKPGCCHGPHVDGRRYFRLAFDPNGAGQLEDYQRRFAPSRSIDQLIALAAAVPPRTRPACEPSADFSNREHGIAVRQLLERIAAAHRSLVLQVSSLREIRRIAATGGGARSPLWLQIKADMLGVSLLRSSSERACLGAATIAAAASGRFSTLDEAALAMIHPGGTFEPNPSAAALYRGQ